MWSCQEQHLNSHHILRIYSKGYGTSYIHLKYFGICKRHTRLHPYNAIQYTNNFINPLLININKHSQAMTMVKTYGPLSSQIAKGMNDLEQLVLQAGKTYKHPDGNRENSPCPEEAKILSAFWRICWLQKKNSDLFVSLQ